MDFPLSLGASMTLSPGNKRSVSFFNRPKVAERDLNSIECLSNYIIYCVGPITSILYHDADKMSLKKVEKDLKFLKKGY